MDTTQETDDATLIAATAGGETSALRGLYERHSVRVFSYLMRVVGERAVAEELLNEVFLEVWRNAGRFEARSAATTWMLAIAHNKAVSSLRRRRETAPIDERVAEIADPAEGPEASAQKADAGRLMRTCLDGLSPDHREVIELAYYQDQSVEQIASILAIPAGTVKTRMFHARRKLGELLRARGVDGGSP